MTPNNIFYFNNMLRSVAEKMAFTLYRTAHSSFVKETEDFTIAVLDRHGRTVVVPMELGATWFAGLDYGPVLEMAGSAEEGDIFCTNDPYEGNVCTHVPDLHVWRPVIIDGEIICYLAGHVHNTDVGGAVPASVSKALTEIQQEGIRIPPRRIYSHENGWNTDLIELIERNVRRPEQNVGDLKALGGAMAIGAREIHRLVARWGVETFLDACERLISESSNQARAFLSTVPDGEYTFHDYCDSDSTGGVPLRIKLNLKINGCEAVMDFTGTDPQVVSSLNIPTGGNPHHTLMLIGCYYVMFSFVEDFLLNAGAAQVFSCILPEGSVLNAQYPAAVGMRSLTTNRVRSVVFGAFCQALPNLMPAAGAGASAIVNVSAYDRRRSRHVIAVLQPMVGGAGGGPQGPGSPGAGADAGYLKNIPIEVSERDVPVLVHAYGLAPGSGGHGVHPGGDATYIKFEVLEPQTRITVRNADRRLFNAWGLAGGKCGSNALIEVERSDGKIERIPHDIDTFLCEPGDVVVIQGSAGGGWGSTDGEAPPTGQFCFGEFRNRLEAIISPSDWDYLIDRLYELEAEWRPFVKKKVLEMLLTASENQPGSADTNDVRRALLCIAHKYNLSLRSQRSADE
jgi:N-methylhydantoinase B